MKITEISPYTVMERFPGYKETVKHLFKNSQNFQTLCSDYRLCAKALQFWTESPIKEAPQRQLEYEALLAELELEILQNIKKVAKEDTNTQLIKERIHEK